MDIQEYSKTTAALAELKVGLKDKKYDCSNALGMATAKFDRRGLVILRTDLEKKRKEIKAPALERCKLIDTEAKRIETELLLLEKPIDDQIKAEEERERAEKAEKARVAAEAQKVIDDKILEIGKMPIQCMNMEAWQITLFLSTLEARQFGPEFTGETLARGEAAKSVAVSEVRAMLVQAEEKEVAEAVLKAEQAAEAARLEAEWVKRERLAAVEHEEMAKHKAELDEQKRLHDIEAARLKEIADSEAAKLAADRAEFEAEQAEVRKATEEAARIEQERQAAIDAENKRIADEAAAVQREADRQTAIVAETARKKAELERKSAEKALRLSAAKCKDAQTAFKKILDICNGVAMSQAEMLTEIALIAEANL